MGSFERFKTKTHFNSLKRLVGVTALAALAVKLLTIALATAAGALLAARWPWWRSPPAGTSRSPPTAGPPAPGWSISAEPWPAPCSPPGCRPGLGLGLAGGRPERRGRARGARARLGAGQVAGPGAGRVAARVGPPAGAGRGGGAGGDLGAAAAPPGLCRRGPGPARPPGPRPGLVAAGPG